MEKLDVVVSIKCALTTNPMSLDLENVPKRRRAISNAISVIKPHLAKYKCALLFQQNYKRNRKQLASIAQINAS